MATNILRRVWRRRHLVMSCLALTLVLVFALNVLESRSLKNSNQRKHKSPEVQTIRSDTFIPEIRSVHIDLKGAPPTVAYLVVLLPLLRSLGATHILLEYEDMFPYDGPLETARAHNHFSRSDVQKIVSSAEKSGLQVIPLIQTFGHLEFALKLEEFSHLREVPSMPQAICPQNNGSWIIIKSMVDQVLSLHPNAKYLHIGCDEVYHLGLCPVCRLKERDALFLNHVARVAQHVRSHGVIPIIWDDMLRQLSSEAIKESKIADIGVEPMIWTYVRDIYRFIPQNQFLVYSQIFPHIWTASAFKGAFGETLTVPNIRMHLENSISWLEVMREMSPHFRSIRGIVVTGWQRYDHLAALCELLPAGLPSLALALLTLTSGDFKPELIFAQFDQRMRCRPDGQHFAQDSERALQLIDQNDPNLFTRAADCQFPGSDVFRLMQRHLEVTKSAKDYIYDVTQHKAWLTEYNIRHNITSPFRVEEALQDFPSVLYSLESLLRSSSEALTQVFDKHTVEEWIEQNVWPHLRKMEALLNATQALKRARVWPKRPLPVPEELKRKLEF